MERNSTGARHSGGDARCSKMAVSLKRVSEALGHSGGSGVSAGVSPRGPGGTVGTGEDKTAPSVGLVTAYWGKKAGALSDEQVRDIHLNHINKHYAHRTSQVYRRQALLRFTGSAIAEESRVSRRLSVLAHARSEKSVGPDGTSMTPRSAPRPSAVERGLSAVAETSETSFATEEELPYMEKVTSAFLVNGGEGHATFLNWVGHLFSLPWKVAIAVLPPAGMHGGWPCFCCAIALIGAITFLIDEVATMLGCCLGIPASITAITFVALGTSLPDTLASRSAALHDDYADDSVGNITGSNSVNVFLGIGLPWVIGSIYWQAQCGIAMPVPAGDLGFSVVIFLCTAVVCIAVLAVRRQTLGYELGGKYRLVSGSILVSLWGLYILFCILQSTGVISAQVGPAPKD